MHLLNFLVIGDWGFNSSDQISVANAMKSVASSNKTDFIISTGDNFYFNGGGYNYDGVLSVNDDKFTDMWEKRYDGALSSLDWYLVLGNHDWYSCPECQVQYSKLNQRWIMPAFFYTKTILNSDFKTAFIFLDVNLLANGIKGDTPAMKENLKKLSKDSVYFIKKWIIKQLQKFSNFDYIFVVGHYPLGNFINLYKGNCPDLETFELKWLRSTLLKYNVSAYFAGHCHALQHAVLQDTHFIISGAGSKYEDACSNRVGWASDNQLGFVQVFLDRDYFKVLFWRDDQTVLRTVNGSRRFP